MLKILIADDDRANRFVLKTLLVRLGHQVGEAVNGEDALCWIRNEVPDVVFTDLGMPIVDGYELAKMIRDDPALRSIVLVAVTGESQDTIADRLRGCGFDYYVTKPVDINRIIELLNQMVMGH